MAKIDLTRHSCDSYSTSRLQMYAQGRTIKRLFVFGVVDVGYGRKEMPFCVSIFGVRSHAVRVLHKHSTPWAVKAWMGALMRFLSKLSRCPTTLLTTSSVNLDSCFELRRWNDKNSSCHGRVAKPPAPIDKWSLFHGVLHFGDKLASTSLSIHNLKTLSLFGLYRSFARRSGQAIISGLLIYIKSTITPQNRINFCNRVFYGKKHS